MRREIKKVYKGQIDLRDYDVEKCIKKKERMEITHGGRKMFLTPEELVSLRISVSHEFTSSTGGKSYRLYGYVWNPKTITV